MTSPIITIENISKRYTLGTKEPYYSLRDSIVDFFHPKKKHAGEFWALKDVSFEVERGEVIGIIGRNGAGKSTLLKILSRITPPTEGKITMHGRVASLLEVGTGFNPELTGRENIYLNGAILGMTKKEIRSKFKEIVEFSEIGKFLDTPVKRYSSGMYVRLAFSVAAHLEPEILIVDEVLAVGDAQFQKKCLGKMGEVAKGGRTVLFVSHNMGAVKQLCNRSVLLEKGEVKMVGRTDEIVANYLEENIETQAITEYPEDNNKKVQIRKVSVLNKNKLPNSDIDISENFFVEVEYDVREDIEKRNYVCLTLYDSNNNIILQIFDIDSDEEYYERRSKGKYQVFFEFPADLFNQQQGKMSIQCGIPLKYNLASNKEEFIDQKDDIALNFFNGDGFSKKFFGGNRPGIILSKIYSKIINLT
jgi:lipopolysaccharide transport system ATP-binding protein